MNILFGILKYKKHIIFAYLLKILILYYIISAGYLTTIKSYFSDIFDVSDVKVKNIKITGTKILSDDHIELYTKSKENIIGSFQLFAPLKKLHNSLNEIPWISNVSIRSRYDTQILEIDIKENIPEFLIIEDGKIFIRTQNGKIIRVYGISKFKKLPVISGSNAKDNIDIIFYIYKVSPKMKKYITAAEYIGNRRWNIVLDNDLVIKLPEDNIQKDWSSYEAWEYFLSIKDKNNLLNNKKIKFIDLRIKNKFIIQNQ